MIIGRTTHTGGMSPPDQQEVRFDIAPDIREVRLNLRDEPVDDALLEAVERECLECTGEDSLGRTTSWDARTLRIHVVVALGLLEPTPDETMLPLWWRQ